MKIKRFGSLVLSLVMVLATLAGCSASNVDVNKISIVEHDKITVSYNAYDDEDGRGGDCLLVDLHTEKQESFLESGQNIKKYAQGNKEFDKSCYLEYKCKDEFSIWMSESEEWLAPLIFSSENGVVKIDNLKIGTIYYVKACINNEFIKLSPIMTSDHGPRVMNVDGVKNVRDIGGWKIDETKRVKQDMIFRCARLNESNIDKVVIEITDKGKSTMLNDMKIRTEIDLRVFENNETGTLTQSPLGNSVAYYNFPMSYENDFYLDSKDMVRDVFKLMADEKNYPIIFHCNIGTDRTGMIAYILNSLLGVCDTDLYSDYLWSNFADIGGSRSLNNLKDSSYFKEMKQMDGETNSEKAYNLLLSLGLSNQEIDSIKNIMKEQISN